MKTGSGIEYLKSKNVAKLLHNEIISPEVPLHTKRANLYALGNIGLSDLGVTYLAHEEGDIIESILSLAKNYPVLSLRGTAL